ncbi:rod shape-determining protein MreD [Sphingomonas sp.]|uniref:rod shape-determining protein MreD n=1 Tax=Sphingomonas sp. TaxID=28214 RepID=UPI00286D6997|nr:rod shape-determining protein MreD [Sphingomonas sp.]
MVRAALSSGRRIGQGPRPTAPYIPAISVFAGTMLSTLPLVSTSGWYPDLGFLVLIAWRLLRSDPWPAWWAAPLGFANDLVTGAPLGMSVVLWSATMVLLDLVDRRTMWRDYWIEWGLAALLLLLGECFEYWIASLTGPAGAFATILPPLLIAIFVFPIAAWLVGRIDRWRLGR